MNLRIPNHTFFTNLFSTSLKLRFYKGYLWQQPFCSDPSLRSGYLALFALAVACLSYHLVELPMLRRREKKGEVAPQDISSIAAAVSTPAA